MVKKSAKIKHSFKKMMLIESTRNSEPLYIFVDKMHYMGSEIRREKKRV